MPGWVVWLIVAGAFGAGELLTTGFFLAPFAFGGAAAAAVAGAGAGEIPAVLVFAVVSILTLALVRPLVQSRLTSKTPSLRTGGAALVGRHGTVIERIDNREGVGLVKIDGELWSARSFDDDREIGAGQRVEVVEIRGATALVIE